MFFSPKKLDGTAETRGGGNLPPGPPRLEDAVAQWQRPRKLVRRQYLWTIIAAWLITVPLSAIFAGGIYAGLRAFLG